VLCGRDLCFRCCGDCLIRRHIQVVFVLWFYLWLDSSLSDDCLMRRNHSGYFLFSCVTVG
jgi:hypothetical protein